MLKQQSVELGQLTDSQLNLERIINQIAQDGKVVGNITIPVRETKNVENLMV